jgi:hypothetical protein
LTRGSATTTKSLRKLSYYIYTTLIQQQQQQQQQTMMIGFGVSLSVLLLQSQAIAAFVLPSTTCSVGNCRSLEPSLQCSISSFHRESVSLTRRFAALDDDDEDYDDVEGPLANGIDSVSWLPSVAGAKGDNMPIESAKEVRYVTLRCCCASALNETVG